MTPSCLSAATVLSNFSVTDKLRCAFLVQFSLVFTFNKQLLDEVEHDIMNYQNRGLCYLPKPKASADNTDTRF